MSTSDGPTLHAFARLTAVAQGACTRAPNGDRMHTRLIADFVDERLDDDGPVSVGKLFASPLAGRRRYASRLVAARGSRPMSRSFRAAWLGGLAFEFSSELTDRAAEFDRATRDGPRAKKACARARLAPVRPTRGRA